MESEIQSNEAKIRKFTEKLSRNEKNQQAWRRVGALERSVAKIGNSLSEFSTARSVDKNISSLSNDIIQLLKIQIDPNYVSGLENLLKWLGYSPSSNMKIDWRIAQLGKSVDSCCARLGTSELRTSYDNFIGTLETLKKSEIKLERTKLGPRKINQLCEKILKKLSPFLKESESILVREIISAEITTE
jgi:hypothetical protein